MMTDSLANQELLRQFLENCYTLVQKGGALEKIRAKAWDHFLELGLPATRSEVFRYLKMRRFYERQHVPAEPVEVDPEVLAPYVLPECRDSVLVMVNGYFHPKLSRTAALPKKIVVTTLAEAAKTYGALINNQWAKSLKEETDPFAALNAALHPEGIFVYLPPKTVVEPPLQILHVIDARGKPMMMMPRMHLFTGAQGQLNLASTQVILSGGDYCVNAAVDFVLDDDAHVKYNQSSINEPEQAWHFDATRASLKRNSTLNTFCATTGGGTVRYDYRVALTGENGEARLNGVSVLNGKNEAHTHVLMDHQAPYCRSMQLYKNALKDFSHASFEGKILVRQAAQKTEAFQLNNNLLLSDRAAADSKPNLEIFADDVKASHGATFGQLDKEQLFYMKTRGFSIKEAQDLLVRGFCKEVIDQFTVPSLLDAIEQELKLC